MQAIVLKGFIDSKTQKGYKPGDTYEGSPERVDRLHFLRYVDRIEAPEQPEAPEKPEIPPAPEKVVIAPEKEKAEKPVKATKPPRNK